MENRAFNDLEGLRIAMEMERRGGDFYRRAARISKNPRAVALLNELADEEQRHRRDFSRLYESRLAQQDGDLREAYDGEAAAYLSAVAADVVFSGGLVELGRDSGFESPVAILKSAIQSEKDSILFYTEIAELTRDGQAKDVFSQILRQEKRHLSRLQEQLMEQE